MAKQEVSMYRAMHHMRKGGLHQALGVDRDQPIPAEKMAEAKDHKNDHVKAMVELAHRMSGSKS